MRLLFLSLALLMAAACQPVGEPVIEPQADSQAPAEADAPAPGESPATAPSEPIAAPDAEGAMCGGVAGISCPGDLFCKQPDGQCLEIMDGSGTCVAMPAFCTREYMPVCGCDGQTYGNACEAAAAGASIAAQGECAGTDVE